MRRIVILIVTSVLLVGCSSTASKENDIREVVKTEVDKETIYQVSTLNALMQGHYEGVISIDDMLKKGNTGIGTFETLDGEMIVLDGTTYKAKADGTVEEVKGDVKTPFSCVTSFESDIKKENVNALKNIDEIKKYLNELINKESGNKNIFYMITMEGKFNMVHVRSVPSQKEPYRPLDEITNEQVEFKYNNVEGTIVALCCPDYVNGINLPGWHFHFISKDKTKGGHLLDADIDNVNVNIDVTDKYNLVLPEDEKFSKMDLSVDLDEKTKKAEGK